MMRRLTFFVCVAFALVNLANSYDLSGYWAGIIQSNIEGKKIGYLIFQISQSGSELEITSPTNSAFELNGEVKKTKLIAAGTDENMNVVEINGSFAGGAGGQIRASYAVTDDEDAIIDKGKISLSRVVNSQPVNLNGLWIVSLTDKFDSDEQPITMTQFIEVVQEPNSNDLTVYSFDDFVPYSGFVIGNTFVINTPYGQIGGVMPPQQVRESGRTSSISDQSISIENQEVHPNTIKSTNIWDVLQTDDSDIASEDDIILPPTGKVIINRAVETIKGYYDWQIDEDRGWGSFTGKKFTGNSVNAEGEWRITSREKYPTKSSPVTQWVELFQDGNDLTLVITESEESEIELSGVLYGNSFIVVGLDSSDAWIRFDGVITGNKVTGTYHYDDGDTWHWGTFSGKR